MQNAAVLLILAAVAVAQEKPLTPEQAAKNVLAAIKAEDAAALKSLAEKDNPDPWLVADLLCAEGKHDAALAFAKAAPRKDTEKLPAYVESRRGKADDPAWRKRLAASSAALGTSKFRDALKALGPEQTGPIRDVVGVRLAHGRGIASAALARLQEAHAAHGTAAAAAERLGWFARAAAAHYDAGLAAYRGGALAATRIAWQRALVVHLRLGNRRKAATTLGNIGIVHSRLGDYAKALSTYEQALAAKAALGDKAGAAGTLGNIGNIYQALGDYAQALSTYERALAAQEALGAKVGAATTLSNIGIVYSLLGDYAQALSTYERALTAQEALGDKAGAARTLGNIAMVYSSKGDYAKALSTHVRVFESQRALGDKAGAATTLGNIGIAYYGLGDYAKALSCYEQALAAQEELGDKSGAAGTLGNIGLVYYALGDHAKALSIYERALAAQVALGDKAGAAGTLGNLGLVHYGAGDYAKALSTYERALAAMVALGNEAMAATTLGNIGLVYYELGDYPKALSTHEQALAAQVALSDKAGAARTLGAIGSVHCELGDYVKALAIHERALTALESLGDKAGAASALGNIGVVYESLGDYAKALSSYERALAALEALGIEAMAAKTLGNIGVIFSLQGNHARALSTCERALAAQVALGDKAGAATTLGNIAVVYSSKGDYAKALSFARRAVLQLATVVAGHGAEVGAGARESHASIYDVGAYAAIAQEDPSELSFFLESGRAAALLEGLKARETLWSAVVPPDLHAAEAKAHGAEVRAQRALRAATDTGNRSEIRARRSELAAAREDVSAVIERIQREAKAASRLVYPQASSLDAIQATLGEDEALVLYVMPAEHAVALVVTSSDARIVPLGETEAIGSMLEKLALGNQFTRDRSRGVHAVPGGEGSAGLSGALAALRERLVTPLKLSRETKRVIVSPVGELACLPFVLVLPGREVAYAPSGTTLGVLRDDRVRIGKGLLALGDPDYSQERDPATRVVLLRGNRLTPLPATRAEAKSIGSSVLLGAEANETSLRNVLKKRKRWRAVHFACHGLIDPERPMLSALALTADKESDGFLTALEIFRMRIPADLVVLSACETGKGKIYKTEGIVGLTRAFMFAGAPRVIVSLWKVDDEATRALMVKFYELWKPGKMATATALKKAQEFVASHDKWKHPYFWAAWQLWGLAE